MITITIDAPSRFHAIVKHEDVDLVAHREALVSWFTVQQHHSGGFLVHVTDGTELYAQCLIRVPEARHLLDWLTRALHRIDAGEDADAWLERLKRGNDEDVVWTREHDG